MTHKVLLPVLVALTSVVVAIPSLSPRGPICGSRGYDTGTDSYFDSDEIGTYGACSKQCQKDKKCKSFAVGDGECYLYNVATSGNFEQDSDSPYAFYEASCIGSGSSSAVTSTSSPVTTTTIRSTTRQTTTTGSKTSQTLTSTTKPSATSTTAKTTASSSTATPTTTSVSSITRSTTTSTTTTGSKTSPTLTTTARPSTTTTSVRTSAMTTSTSSASSTPPCPYPTWTITNFRFVNSSHNLDCAGADFNNDLCATGKNPQPAGYGPPDSIAADISQIGSCAQRNPGSVPLREIGDGNVVRCSGSQIQFEFHGDSRSAFSSPLFALQNTVFCDNGQSYRAYGQANIPMTCTYDSSQNATCLLYRGTGSVVPSSWSA